MINSLKIKNKNVKELYSLPEKIKFCKNCTISNQRPRITFDDNGVCSACNYAVFKQTKIDWEKREIELTNLCNNYRKNNGEFDCIVPCSGGKDGSFVAHQLKYKYKMNPLCVTWSPLIPTDIGKTNLENFINSGFSHIMGTPNPIVAKKLTKLSFLHLGDPFQPFIYGQTNYPLKIAFQNNIKLIFYGENGEVEYGGNMKSAHSPTRNINDHSEMYFSKIPPEKWLEYGLSGYEIEEFKSPEVKLLMDSGIQVHFFGYYKFWDPQENFYYCSENTGFNVNPERTEGTYSKYASLDDKLDGFHYYLSYIKFGIGRTTSDTAHEIRDNKITREEGIALVKKYDGEFPNKYLNEFLKYTGIEYEIFHEILDSWRSDHIWTKKSNSWVLKNAIYSN